MCCGAGKVVKAGAKIATGFAYLAAGVNTDLSKERLKKCNNCPRLVGGLICSECGCEVHAKTRLPEEQCPLKKWI
jgi:hypothetical protein